MSEALLARIGEIEGRSGRFDPGELRYLRRVVGFVDEARITSRLDAFEAHFAAAAEAARAHVDDPRFDDDTRAAMREAFDAGDFLAVEILASTRPRVRSLSPARQAFLDRVRARAEAAGVGIGGEGTRLASELLSKSAIEARAAAIVAEARELDLESVGPYNAYALALRIFARMDEIGPSYLAAWIGWLEDLAALKPPEPEARPTRPKRR